MAYKKKTNIKPEPEKAIVILSGGQDSTTCLFWAIKKFNKENVYALTFDYKQRHKIEITNAKKIAKLAGVKHKILKINTFNNIGGNSLTDNINVQNTRHKMPNTFVPGRNIIFITFAASFAYTQKIKNIVTGVCETDYSGYPDCRKNTLISLEKTLVLGIDFKFKLHYPLISLSKAQSILLAQKLGIINILAYTHTCYNGLFPPCQKCNACKLRAKGFKEANIEDPLIIRARRIIQK